MSTPGCGTHATLGAELRAVAVLALDRLGPVLDRAREGGPGTPSSCATCPVCALAALLRGERPELAVRLAEHAAGLLAVLQAALHEEGEPPPRPAEPPAPARRVQHIPVERPVAAS
jgi:hypothetical protein